MDPDSLRITTCGEPLLAQQPVEVVERKGIGHPDTICDCVAEEVSVALCRHYIEHFGAILHHNVDKVLLVGGRSEPCFGGGRIPEPLEIFIAGRVTDRVQDKRIAVESLATEACRAWLRDNLRHVDVERDVRIQCRLRPGSGELVGIFAQGQGGPVLANDTSCGVGFAPMTPVEQLVLELESGLRSPQTLDAHPYLGEDIKLMAVRHGERTELTVADAFVDRHVSSLDDYRQKRNALQELVTRRALRADVPAQVGVNVGDKIERGLVYLTVSGTSAESGDDGEAGRGNRASGLITPMRPMTMESVAGKNPASHVGKIYNVAAQKMAARLVEAIEPIHGAEIFIVSRIGHPIDEPQLMHVRVRLAHGVSVPDVRARVQQEVHATLAGLADLTRDFVERRVRIV